MSQPLLEDLSEKTAPGRRAGRVALYRCECGAKWNDSARATWKCKCGRHLVKKNGTICAAINQPSGPKATDYRILHVVAD